MQRQVKWPGKFLPAVFEVAFSFLMLQMNVVVDPLIIVTLGQ